jgi:hypothetical protein
MILLTIKKLMGFSVFLKILMDIFYKVIEQGKNIEVLVIREKST